MPRNKSKQRRLRSKAFVRDKGICNRCGRNCKLIDDELNRLYQLDLVKGDVCYLANEYMRSIGLHSWSSWHAHHIVKRCDGGTDTLDNIETVCQWCHDGLHAKHTIRLFLEPVQ